MKDILSQQEIIRTSVQKSNGLVHIRLIDQMYKHRIYSWKSETRGVYAIQLKMGRSGWTTFREFRSTVKQKHIWTFLRMVRILKREDFNIKHNFE